MPRTGSLEKPKDSAGGRAGATAVSKCSPLSREPTGGGGACRTGGVIEVKALHVHDSGPHTRRNGTGAN